MAQTRYVDVDAEVGGDGTTNGLTGATCAYKSLNIWEAARQADLTSAEPEICICGSNHATTHTADTTAPTIFGWTTTAANYIEIKSDSGSRAGTSWSANKYRLSITDAVAVNAYEDYVRLDGLQIETISPTASARHVINLNLLTATTNYQHISNCLIKGHGHGTYTQHGIVFNDVDANTAIWNTIIYNVAALAGNRVISFVAATLDLYSCTLIGGANTVFCHTGTLTAKNCYAGGSLTEDWNRNSGTLAKTNCASEDQSADDTNTGETATNCVAAAVVPDTGTFVSVTPGSEDFALCVGSPLIGVGTDTSGDGTVAGAGAATDILGTTRS